MVQSRVCVCVWVQVANHQRSWKSGVVSTFDPSRNQQVRLANPLKSLSFFLFFIVRVRPGRRCRGRPPLLVYVGRTNEPDPSDAGCGTGRLPYIALGWDGYAASVPRRRGAVAAMAPVRLSAPLSVLKLDPHFHPICLAFSAWSACQARSCVP